MVFCKIKTVKKIYEKFLNKEMIKINLINNNFQSHYVLP